MKVFFKRFLYIITVFFIVFSIPARSAPDINTVLKKMEAYILHAMDLWGAPGCAVAIVQGDKVIYKKAFGYKSVDAKDPVDEHTVFPLSSLTKNITAVIMAQFVEKKRIHWDDKAIQYLPGLEFSDPEVTQHITLQDMFSHKVGLPHFTGDTLGYLGWSGEEIFKGLKFIPFHAALGSEFDYQNTFYGFMGWIIIKLTGKDLNTVYTENLFQPLGMTDANIGPIKQETTITEKLKQLFTKKADIRVEKNLVTTHDHSYPRGPHARPIPYNNYFQALPASSGINASISDMGQWLLFWINGQQNQKGHRLLQESTVRYMTTPYISIPAKKEGGNQFPAERVKHNGYGVGLYIHDYLGHEAWTQMGGLNGARSLMTILPHEKVGIIILSNLGGMRVSFLPESIRDKFCDLWLETSDDIDWATQKLKHMQKYQEDYHKARLNSRLKNPTPLLSDLSAYAGTYENELYGKIEIHLRDSNLYLKYRNLPTVKLTHWNGNLFSFKPDELAPNFPGVDAGDLMFYVQNSQVNGLAINIMSEGRDSDFHRVK